MEAEVYLASIRIRILVLWHFESAFRVFDRRCNLGFHDILSLNRRLVRITTRPPFLRYLCVTSLLMLSHLYDSCRICHVSF